MTIYQCRMDSKSPLTYSVRKKCRYCTPVPESEKAKILEQMALKTPQ